MTSTKLVQVSAMNSLKPTPSESLELKDIPPSLSQPSLHSDIQSNTNHGEKLVYYALPNLAASGKSTCYHSGVSSTPRAFMNSTTTTSNINPSTICITNHRFSTNTVLLASEKVSTTESDCEDINDEDTNSSDNGHDEEFKAQLVLNATRAQRDVRLAEKKLADCILKENTALGVLYQFKATEAERKLEDADMDIGYCPGLVTALFGSCHDGNSIRPNNEEDCGLKVYGQCGPDD
ncbi:uncharacterized protein F5891DRAFT_979209 [Suillus fuscotomentosus]|uniref:Uncharacterized protein n=1 Tax=Suillus fuscotomentosus TaxID=1912939 RepID=A0AAD4E8R2_9AGAM|nr:uncharacterized protein F5891DRAFT_979209 [Suillus fuscotomentosus]KAG1901701.1 hypothetical protein F5891DRAFT_979209 [Suillus fuscotomentosus]